MFKKGKKSIGLEISDSVIRVTELVFYKDEWRVSGANEINLPFGIVERGIIRDNKALARSLKRAFSGAKPQAIRGKVIFFALPDELLKTHIFKGEISTGKGIKQVVEKELENTIGADVSNYDMSFRVIDTKQGPGYSQISSVVLALAMKNALQMWQDFFDSLGIKIEYFDISALALYRGFYDERQNTNLGLLRIGENNSKLSIFSNLGLEYSIDFSIGLNDIASDFNASNESSHVYLEERGLKTGDRSEELEDLALQVKNTLSKVNSRIADSSGQHKGINLNVKKILICGDGGTVSGLSNLMSMYLPGLEFLNETVRGFADDSGMRYAETLGLAIRQHDGVWEKSDPLLACIGNSYSLERRLKNSEGERRKFFSILKNIIFIPIFLLLIIFGVWMLWGVLSTSWEKNNKVDISSESITTSPPSTIVNTEEPQINDTATSSNTEILEEPESVTKTPTLKKQYLIVNNDIGQPLNVRKGPGRTYPIIGEANEGSEQVMLEEKDGWFRIEWANEENAWVSGDYVKKSE